MISAPVSRKQPRKLMEIFFGGLHKKGPWKCLRGTHTMGGPSYLSIVLSGLRAGNVFRLPVRTLVGETIPHVSAPPENSGEF